MFKILGRSDISQQVSSFSNVEETTEIFEDNLATGDLLSSISSAIPDEEFREEQPDEELNLDQENFAYDDDLKEDAIEYLAGYIIKKLKIQNVICESSSSFTWVDQVSEGGLKKPSLIFKNKIVELEKVFLNFNKQNIYNNSKFLEHHIQNSNQIVLPLEVKKLYFRTRLYIRLRHLNNSINQQENSRKKRKLIKTIT